MISNVLCSCTAERKLKFSKHVRTVSKETERKLLVQSPRPPPQSLPGSGPDSTALLLLLFRDTRQSLKGSPCPELYQGDAHFYLKNKKKEKDHFRRDFSAKIHIMGNVTKGLMNRIISMNTVRPTINLSSDTLRDHAQEACAGDDFLQHGDAYSELHAQCLR